MRYPILLITWLLTDLLVFVGAYALAYFLRVGQFNSTDFPFEPYIKIVALVAPAWLLVLVTTRAFALTRNQARLRNIAYISYSAVVGTALFSLSFYFLYGEFFSRKLLMYAVVLSAAFVWIWHVLFSRVLREFLRKGKPVFPTLIVGVTRESKELISVMNRNKSPLVPVAVLDGRGAKEVGIDGVPVRGKLNKLDEVLQEGVTHLIQCSDIEQSLNLLSACRQKQITYMILPSVLGIVERDERIESLEGHQVTQVGPKESKLMWFFK